MGDLDKMVTSKENKWNPKLNKLDNNVKKLKYYVEENNDKIIAMKNKLDYTENERTNLLSNINQLYNELKETKNELNKSGNDELKKRLIIKKMK